MSILHSIILGIIEGLTEFLPISSTAHLIMGSSFLGLPQDEFVKTFEVVIQLGAILSVLFLYAEKILRSPKIIIKMFLGFLPTAALGFLLYPFIKDLFESPLIISGALILGGIFLLFFDRLKPESKTDLDSVENLSNSKAVAIGFIQSIAMVPGVSRAASTIVGSRFMGLNRKAAVEFSFLLALPTIAAASGYDLLKSGFSFSQHEISLLIVGTIASFISAYLAIRWMISYVANHSFKFFGIYRIIIGIVFLIFSLL